MYIYDNISLNFETDSYYYIFRCLDLRTDVKTNTKCCTVLGVLSRLKQTFHAAVICVSLFVCPCVCDQTLAPTSFNSAFTKDV